eukprot:359979-Chlamydomonas_euryale.AAC.4
MEQGHFISVPPGLPVQGTFRRRCSNLWPKDQFRAASQLEKVPKSCVSAEAFFMARLGCRAVHPRQIFSILQPCLNFSCSLWPSSVASVAPCGQLQ